MSDHSSFVANIQDEKAAFLEMEGISRKVEQVSITCFARTLHGIRITCMILIDCLAKNLFLRTPSLEKTRRPCHLLAWGGYLTPSHRLGA